MIRTGHMAKVVLVILILAGMLSCSSLAHYGMADCATMSGKTAQSCQDYRQRKASADISQEMAELLRSYRACLQNYDGDLVKAKDSCAAYSQVLQGIEIKTSGGCSCC